MAADMVGARRLKSRLGRYLRQVREGATIVVTERGEPVAELRPLPAAGVSARLRKLAAQGAICLPSALSLPRFRPISKPGVSLAESVIQNREERF